MIEAGRKLTPRGARKLAEDGLKQLLVPNEELFGRYLALDMVNAETGEIYAEAGDEVNEKVLEELTDAGFDEIALLDIDHVNVGSYIRNTLLVDKNQSREQALIDIYRVMRPGEPPTLDTAETLFNGLFFDSGTLRPLGRRPREDELAPQPRRAGHDAHPAPRRSARGREDRCTICATARAKSTTSTTWRTAACVRSAS